jgi:hypothetical protein
MAAEVESQLPQPELSGPVEPPDDVVTVAKLVAPIWSCNLYEPQPKGNLVAMPHTQVEPNRSIGLATRRFSHQAGSHGGGAKLDKRLTRGLNASAEEDKSSQHKNSQNAPPLPNVYFTAIAARRFRLSLANQRLIRIATCGDLENLNSLCPHRPKRLERTRRADVLNAVAPTESLNFHQSPQTHEDGCLATFSAAAVAPAAPCAQFSWRRSD